MTSRNSCEGLIHELKTWKSTPVSAKKPGADLCKRVAAELLRLAPKGQKQNMQRAMSTELENLLKCWLEGSRPLPDIDPVHRCVATIGPLLEIGGNKSFLTNGKIEMALKVFLGAAWERQDKNRRAYVMDKTFKRKGTKGRMGGIDFLALQHGPNGGEAAFWIETKCSMLEDRGNGSNDALSAIAQVSKTVGKLDEALDRADAYIVHFLTSVPQAYDPVWKLYPQFVKAQYDRYAWAKRVEGNSDIEPKERRNSDIGRLHGIYINSVEQPSYQSSAVIEICADPFVAAIVVKLGD